MRFWLVPAVALTVLLSGCMTAEEQRAADEQRCREYGFKKRNDAFAECMQRLDLDRRARLRGGPYVDGFAGTAVVVID
jgi:hypothetical protein